MSKKKKKSAVKALKDACGCDDLYAKDALTVFVEELHVLAARLLQLSEGTADEILAQTVAAAHFATAEDKIRAGIDVLYGGGLE